VVIVTRILEFLCRRIREKFLEFHFDGQADLVEAANALSRRHGGDLGGHENPVVEPLEADIQNEGSSLGDEGHAFTEPRRRGKNEVFFSFFSGAM
jgi:hypothetical protein